MEDWRTICREAGGGLRGRLDGFPLVLADGCLGPLVLGGSSLAWRIVTLPPLLLAAGSLAVDLAGRGGWDGMEATATGR